MYHWDVTFIDVIYIARILLRGLEKRRQLHKQCFHISLELSYFKSEEIHGSYFLCRASTEEIIKKRDGEKNYYRN
jgi:hypothetical protein